MSNIINEFQHFIDDCVGRIEPLYKEMCESYWQASLTGKEEDAAKAAAMETRFRKIFSNAGNLSRLKAWRDSGEITEPLLERQLILLINAHLENQMDAEMLQELVQKQRDIETAFSTHRPEVHGAKMTDNEIRRILKESTDSHERRRAWEGSKEVGAHVAAQILELAALRNKVARDLGFENYYVMALELQEQTEQEVMEICRTFEKLSDAPFRKLRREMDAKLAARFGIRPDEMRPWHYEDPFFQDAPALEDADLDPLFAGRNLEEITRDFYEGIGLPVGDILKRSDLYEREGKNQHAYCIDVDRNEDVRVLCNIKPSTRWMSTMLHEFGHAVYDKYLDMKLPFLLRTASHTFTTEAVAMLMGRLAQEESWLREVLRVPQEKLSKVAVAARKQLRTQMLVSTRWMLVMIHFERELYRGTGTDLNSLWWDLVEQFQVIRRPEKRDAPDWASKIHIACFPVYYHNYLWGEFMASQLRGWIDREILPKNNTSIAGHPAVGRYLKEKIFSPGTGLRWDELLRRSTGESLNPEYFVKQFVEV
ncbi:MAG: M2 family metallopeptidase [Candidatus Eisenbacteria bacterium]|uniref:M2 family metallopeptidase n=1 Tax=Eiseniibacteriota bacterium TaxID=2212470 RepID=A0A948RSF1_UNCEI|nr:M2 family metallopeptidase [Candidatus Eisenbacteria bacterium]MBU1950769.1 M2 family metallopeptidase [Candidatus Eisenbacteria bacterium]MBU2690153.1 M2 family metallopeptidase [Candidatus Eisenbacteria bacterium]